MIKKLLLLILLATTPLTGKTPETEKHEIFKKGGGGIR